MKFRIYYADGSTFGSEQGAWEDAPLDGVIMIATAVGERVGFHAGHDFYAGLGEGDEFTIADTADILPLLRQHARWIKHGVWTSHNNFERISQRAREEFGA